MKYEFDWDEYLVYLGTDMDSYTKTIPCTTLEQIQMVLNKADLYEKYIVIGVSYKRNEYFPIMSGRITPNRVNDMDKTHKKGR